MSLRSVAFQVLVAAAAVVATYHTRLQAAQALQPPVWIRPTAENIAPVLTAYGGGADEAAAKWASSLRWWGPASVKDLESVLASSAFSARTKAAFVLELFVTSVYPPLLETGRTLLAQHGPLGVKRGDDEFEVLWHHTALGAMQGGVRFTAEDQYLDEIDPRFEDARRRSVEPANRFALARAIAAAGLCCWNQESWLTSRGMAIAITNAPRRRVGTLEFALSLFEDAARIDALRTEALIRGAVLLFEGGRERKALEWFERVPPHDDIVLGYVQHLTHGRVLDALDRPADAAAAYRRALAILPGAQTAGIGLAAALLRTGSADEAVEVAAAARRGGTSEAPRLTFHMADARFIPQWLSEIRRLK